MHPKGSCKCLSCGEFFIPDARNRGRQKRCGAPACRQASKAVSQARWRAKPDNADYFKGSANTERVRTWRSAHPGYAKRSRRRSPVALQDPLIAQTPAPQPPAAPDAGPLQVALQERSLAQDPLLVGLVAHLADTTLQEDIAQLTRRLTSRGRAVLGLDVLRSAYDHQSKTSDQSHAPPTGAAFV
jgi:hypothetical protein